MDMVEKDLNGNVIERAIKITSFRKVVCEICRRSGIDMPTDEKMAEWIEKGLPIDAKAFVVAYKSHTSIFEVLKTPLEKFKDEVYKIEWGENKPTEDDIVAFFNTNGNNVSLFCQLRTIKGMKPLVRKTFFKTYEKLSVKHLAKLWNTFIEESGLYGEDSYIYDLSDLEDSKFLTEHMNGAQLKTITNMVTQNDTRFIQWFALNDGSIKAKTDEDIKSTFIAYWEEIFERIMLYPSAYSFNVEIHCEGDGSTYFDDVFFPIIAKEVGYLIDGDKGTIKEIEK